MMHNITKVTSRWRNQETTPGYLSHKGIDWRQCVSDHCTHHYQQKMENGIFPQPTEHKMNLGKGKPRRELACTMSRANHLTMKITLSETEEEGLSFKGITAMIDSGASGNFITKKKHPYELGDINGNLITGNLDEETVPIEMRMIGADKDHVEILSLDVVDGMYYDVILGAPWLIHHSPNIDWDKRKIRFTKCKGHCDKEPKHETKMPKMELAFTKQNYPQDTLIQWIDLNEGKVIQGSVPKEYHQFMKLFKEEPNDERALPEHGPWDHEIILKEGAEPGKG